MKSRAVPVCLVQDFQPLTVSQPDDPGSPEVDDPLSDVYLKVISSLMLHHTAYIIYLTSSSHTHLIISHRHKKDEHSTIRYETETTVTKLILQYIVTIALFYCC